jgi:polysaccharide export outer membrane protein
MRQLKKMIAIFILFHLLVFAQQSEDIDQQIVQKDSQNIENYTYKAGVDDIIRIDVYDNPDLSGDFTISSDGTISYPLLGQVYIEGCNVKEIKNRITDLLEKDYLYHPIVSVTIKDYKSKVVYVLGSVGKPGTYYLDRPTRLFDLLTRADGISDNLGKSLSNQKIHILRKYSDNDTNRSGSSKIKTVYVDLYKLLIESEEDANVTLTDGDVVFVPKMQSVHVIGEVKNAGSFPFEEGMTVLKAISLAGGPTKIASTRNVVIKRIEENQEIKIKVEMSDVVKPDDIIEVPISFW